MDNDNDTNENVRQPDQVIVETLIDNASDFYDYDNEAYLYNEEINRTINVSMLELKRKEEETIKKSIKPFLNLFYSLK